MATAPARRVGLAGKGEIVVGADADLCVFAPDEEWVVDAAALHHKNPVTPYAGRTLTGTVRATWLRGATGRPVGPTARPTAEERADGGVAHDVLGPEGRAAAADRPDDRPVRAAVFTEAYAVLPRGTMTDIVASRLPHWDDTRLWVIARPLSGFAETFSWYVVEVAPGGGTDRPDDDPDAESVLFVVGGRATLTVGDETHSLGPGGYAFVPPGTTWTLRSDGDGPSQR